MKILAKTAITAVIAAAMSFTTAQAQMWTNVAGAPLLIGTPITVAGPLDISLFGWIGRKTCNVSIDGSVTDLNVITFTQATPGFVSNCSIEDDGEVQFPFDVHAEKPLFSSKRAAVSSLIFYSVAGPCTSTAVKFDWYNAPVSKGVLPANVTASPCTLHSGSYLQVTGAMAGNVSIN